MSRADVYRTDKAQVRSEEYCLNAGHQGKGFLHTFLDLYLKGKPSILC